MTSIKIKKSKMYFISMISIVFVWLGISLIQKASIDNSLFNQYVFLILGTLMILLFGLISLVLFIKYFDNKSGLYFKNDVILFKPSMFQHAEINWQEIKEIKFQYKQGRNIILPIFTNSQEIITRQNSWISKQIMKANMKQLQTPIPIYTDDYNCDYEQLKILITDNFNNSHSKTK